MPDAPPSGSHSRAEGPGDPDSGNDRAVWRCWRPTIAGVLTVGFGLLVLVAVSSVLWVVLGTAQKNTVTLLRQTADSAVASLIDEIGIHLGAARRQTEFLAEMIAKGEIDAGSRERLADAMATDIHWAKDIYGVLEAQGQKPVDRPLAALNTALATDGVVIRVTGKASKPINLIYLHEDVSSDAILHNVVKVEAGAELTLLETGPAAARFSKQLEVDVAEGGTFNHVRVQGRDHERRAVTHCFARIGAKSTFKSFTLTFNGVLTRNECVLDIVGDDAVAHVAGACVGDGRDFHHDDTVFVTHDAVNCESRQVFKKVLRNGATGVFQGKILVKEGAQKTDGYQISQSLLLDDDSQFLAKPELEIYADDVACSHGSTSGAIDETALFYLRSRGVSHDDARNLLTLSFLAEALEEIADEGLAEELRDRLEGWLSRHR